MGMNVKSLQTLSRAKYEARDGEKLGTRQAGGVREGYKNGRMLSAHNNSVHIMLPDIL